MELPPSFHPMNIILLKGRDILGEYNTLQGKYVSDIDSMSRKELETFLTYTRGDIDSPFRNRRIKVLERKLGSIDRAAEVADEQERKWKTAGYEYVALTEKWLAAGAYHYIPGYDPNDEYISPHASNWTIWELDGEEFFRWKSGWDVFKVLEEAREGDAAFEELIKK